jgi:hypothetical protein
MALTELNLGYDTTFELDDFGKPRLRGEGELIKNVLCTVLFYKPGQYPSLPLIGLDIGELLHSHYDDIQEAELRDSIIRQCGVLGAYFNSSQIQLRKVKYRGKPSLMINVQTADNDLFTRDKVDVGLSEDPSQYLIGISFDELNEMIYNISEVGVR